MAPLKRVAETVARLAMELGAEDCALYKTKMQRYFTDVRPSEYLMEVRVRGLAGVIRVATATAEAQAALAAFERAMDWSPGNEDVAVADVVLGGHGETPNLDGAIHAIGAWLGAGADVRDRVVEGRIKRRVAAAKGDETRARREEDLADLLAREILRSPQDADAIVQRIAPQVLRVSRVCGLLTSQVARGLDGARAGRLDRDGAMWMSIRSSFGMHVAERSVDAIAEGAVVSMEGLRSFIWREMHLFPLQDWRTSQNTVASLAEWLRSGRGIEFATPQPAMEWGIGTAHEWIRTMNRHQDTEWASRAALAVWCIKQGQRDNVLKHVSPWSLVSAAQHYIASMDRIADEIVEPYETEEAIAEDANRYRGERQ